jgi:hypothetical protein
MSGSRRAERGFSGIRRLGALAAVIAVMALVACQGESLSTRTFDIQYLRGHQVESLLAPYVYTDREGSPGMMSVTDDAVTVRETADNLERIGRVLERYDRPRPSVMLHFQIIEADGAADSDPAIAEVERELRRLFRFDGYELVAETQVGGIQGTALQQVVGGWESQDGFMIRGGVTEVRAGGDPPTVTVDVGLSASRAGDILETTVTIPVGHSVVLGTASSPHYEGALILVVRAEIMESGMASHEPSGSA